MSAAESALAAGNLLAAFDAATRAIDSGAGTPRLRYFQILALARMNETQRAHTLYRAHFGNEDGDLDIMALRARLVKDAALRANDPAQFAEASRIYAEVFARTRDPFPAINAATMAFLACDYAGARAFAQQALAALGTEQFRDYYAAATAAEAHLLLGDGSAANEAITIALKLPGSNHGARSSTSRQLRLIAAAAGRGQTIADQLVPPPVLTYCGHMLVADPAIEALLRQRIEAALDDLGSTIAYGALACGADILIAEAMLARGGELNLVLPFLADDFMRISVACGGESWVARYHRCIESASEVIIASETHGLGDDRQYEYGSMLMMGYARLRAVHLGTRAVQLAIWDGVVSDGVAGTGADVRTWRENGGHTYILPFARDELPRPASVVPDKTLETEREVRAMIFTDFAGFSRIPEPMLPDFWQAVMGRVSAVVDRYEEDVCSSNTWGDALFVVTRGARSAAGLALDLQAALDQASMTAFGVGAGMRVSVHLGAVYRAVDPVTRSVTFYGREVNRTARIEPITSVGEVYVTRAFAAVLEMEEPGRFDLSYVGRVPLAKSFGEESMYRLSLA